MEWGHSAHLYTYIMVKHLDFESQIPFSMKNSLRFQTVALPNAHSSVFSHRRFQWSTPLIPRNPNCQSFFLQIFVVKQPQSASQDLLEDHPTKRKWFISLVIVGESGIREVP